MTRGYQFTVMCNKITQPSYLFVYFCIMYMIVVEADVNNLLYVGRGMSEVVNPSSESGNTHITLTDRLSESLLTLADTRSPS